MLAGLVVLLVAVVGGAALLGGRLPFIASGPSSSSSSASVAATTAESTATPTPIPTRAPLDVFVGYEVAVDPGTYLIFEVDASGSLVRQLEGMFDSWSRGSVEKITAPNGLLHWRTSLGGYTGMSYIRGRSGPFVIREVWRAPNGDQHYVVLGDNDT